jgi:hypothetical protein
LGKILHMLESVLQRKIIHFLEKEGFLVVKIIQCNKNGFPDLQVMKSGVTFFIEVKSENGKLSALQKYRHNQLIKLGFFVFTCSSLKELQNEFINISQKLHEQRIIGNLN